MSSSDIASVEASPVGTVKRFKKHRRSVGLPRFFSEKSRTYRISLGSTAENPSPPSSSPQTPKTPKSPKRFATKILRDSGSQRKIQDLLDKGHKAQRKLNYDKALNLYDKAISINPNNSEAWNRKGYVSHLSEKDCQAIECYDLSIKHNPKNALAWNNKGGVYLGLGKYVDALVCFNEAIMIDPEYTVGWNNKGVTLRNMGRFNEALDSHDKALALNPNDPHTLVQMGRVSFLLEDYSNSLSYFDRAIKIEPKYYQALYGKGVLLREIGDHENALKMFNKALLLNPYYQEDHWLSTRPSLQSSGVSQPSNNNSESDSIIRPVGLDLSKSSRGENNSIHLDLFNRSKPADFNS